MAHTTAPGSSWSGYNSSSGHNTTYSTTEYRSESTEQLDKLLAGLDELSETLPNLSDDLHHQHHLNGGGGGGGGGEGRKHQQPPRAGTWNGSKNISSGSRGRGQDSNMGSVSRPGSAGGGTVRPGRAVNQGDMRTYEEDLDYALEREPGGGVIRGPERRPLVGTDNYGQVYSEAGATHQPYHTRYDSKPFSYIR